MDLIPVISYLLLLGRCRYCADMIPIRYPLVELITACLFSIIYVKFGMSIAAIAYLIYFSLLLLIAFIDLENMIIPDFLVIIGIISGLIYSAYSGRWTDSLIGICAGFLFMFVMGKAASYLLKKEALGDGDVKLVVMIAAYSGAAGIFWSVFAGSLIGSLVGVILILSGKIKKDDRIPFGPFLALGALISVVL